MELKEARHRANELRKSNLKPDDYTIYKVAIILDDRITELEAQRDELKKKVKSLEQMVRRREAHLNVIERMNK